MSNDLLMLRGETSGYYNLAVGEPVFLQETAFWCAPKSVMTAEPRYPPFGGDPRLIDLIRHHIKQAKKHVVVTMGAKQALLAAFHGYKERGFQPKSDIVLDNTYWPSYPTLARLSGMRSTTMSIASSFIERTPQERNHTKEYGYSKYMRVITSPNNPDGSESMENCDVWDAAYYHWLYGAKVVPQHTVSIWSAAKLLGLSGIRVGFLTTDDDDIAQYAREYVEKTTSGVPNDSQKRLADVLDAMATSPDRVAEDYAKARNVLLDNGKIFGETLSSFCSEIRGVPTDGRGMFSWFKSDAATMDRALSDSKVKVIPGNACGALWPYEIGANGMAWYRMSMGNNNKYTRDACEALAASLRSIGYNS